MGILGTYKNGNYNVTLFDNGTKIRENDLDFFESSFPENIDIKITNYCDMDCPYCHEDSSREGKHGNILDKDFLDTLHPFTELAIGGGNPLSHPDLEEFLIKLRERDIIPNITINQFHFIESYKYVVSLVERELVFGVGVSMIEPTNNFIEKMYSLENGVIHLINGIVTERQIKKLSGKDLKILILGYKDFGRGKTYTNHKQDILKRILDNNPINLFKSFKVVSFDNLALDQLNIREVIGEGMWERLYMGNDGDFTMYIDLVEEKFGMNSTSKVRYPLKNNINDMFKVVKNGN
jgi:hypothetical protein